MAIMITYHGYSNGHNNPMYNMHKNVGAHYTWQNVAFEKIMEENFPNLIKEIDTQAQKHRGSQDGYKEAHSKTHHN